MKVPLLLCVVMLSAISASAQCTHEPVAKPLRVSLLMEASTPIIVQNAFLNGLRSIPDVVVKTGVSAETQDVVVYTIGLETKDTYGNVMGDTWYYEAYRYWPCDGPARKLEERLDESLHIAPLNRVEGVVQEDVAQINVKTFEKLRQEREASHR